ncbi:GAF domain-containing protein [Microvirga massiliensis]|uniref:GAF domain-containing protein n=1 Tax=Microvirga massiliensis TaxID=1033741 RepID=UPI00062BB611|nr:GAF domain-containing protein [Microvirga massiliensis]
MYPLLPTEVERLHALLNLAILDIAPAAHFDAVVLVAQRAFGVPVAVISLVDQDRQWFKARCRLEIDSTPREMAFCTYPITSDDVLVIEDATQDERFRENRLFVGEPRVWFYAGAPLILDPGIRVGPLCVIDTAPRTFTSEQCDELRDLAQIVVAHLRLRAAQAASQAEVALRRANEETLREQDRLLSMAEQIAHVGHWRISLLSQEFTWSEEVYRIFGLTMGA